MNCRTRGFADSVAGVPSASKWACAGPLIGTSSTKTIVCAGISSCKMNVTSSWNMGTEFVQPMGSVTSRCAPNGVWNVVKSREDSAISRSSYPTYRSSKPRQGRPANCSAIWSGIGGTPEC